MSVIKVTDEAGSTRVYRFDDSSFRVGFRLESHIILEPSSENGAEIMISQRPDKSFVVQSTRDAGRFNLNGTSITAILPVKVGDVITSGKTKILLEKLITGKDAQRAKMKEKLLKQQEEMEKQRKEQDSESKAEVELNKKKAIEVQPKSAMDYLLLFFNPVREYLEDDRVSEVMINGPKQIYVERKGKLMLTEAEFINEQALRAAVMNVARSVNRIFNQDNPRLDARLPDGSRVHAVIPPLSRVGTLVAIRKFSKDSLTIEQLIKFGSITQPVADLIDIIVKLHKNVMVSGATSSGKTSVLNVLSSCIGPEERILILEDSSELQLQQTHTVYCETRKPDEHGKGEVTIRDLVHSALRLRPDRLVVGEIRGGEALDLLQAMNTGHDGSMSTIHANTPRDTMARIETCALLSGIEIPLNALREQVASAIHVVVQTARLFDGSRKIINITEILGLENRDYVLQDLMYFRHDSIDAEDRLIGQHVITDVKPTFFEEAVRRRLPVEKVWGSPPAWERQKAAS